MQDILAYGSLGERTPVFFIERERDVDARATDRVGRCDGWTALPMLRILTRCIKTSSACATRCTRFRLTTFAWASPADAGRERSRRLGGLESQRSSSPDEEQLVSGT